VWCGLGAVPYSSAGVTTGEFPSHGGRGSLALCRAGVVVILRVAAILCVFGAERVAGRANGQVVRGRVLLQLFSGEGEGPGR